MHNGINRQKILKSAFFSSNVDEVIRAISNLFIYENILQAQKVQNANKRINEFLPLRCAAFLFLFACMRFVLFVLAKSFCKKKKRFENALMTSFTLLLTGTVTGS